MTIGMNAYNTHKREQAKHLKGKESLSDYKPKRRKISKDVKELREAILNL